VLLYFCIFCILCVAFVFVFVCSCVVCCCDCVVLGFVCPYSSVVEHPLSKRKVGSSILLGGISLCYTHRMRLVFNTKTIALFCLSIITAPTHDTTCLNYKSFTLHCNVYKYEQQQRVLNSVQAFLRIQTPTSQLFFVFPPILTVPRLTNDRLLIVYHIRLIRPHERYRT
jgi:hypothetical protein